MNNLKNEQEQWEEETNPITDETLNEMQNYYENEEGENKRKKKNKVEIKVIPSSSDWGELKYLGYDY